ncbi:MAG: LOG family protein [Rhodospirillaceae bacterium]
MSDPRPGKSTVIPPKAYENPDFLHSREARAIRILSEYQEPLSRFEHYDIDDTIVFMGSARIKSAEDAAAMAAAAARGEADPKEAERAERMSVYYEAARKLAFRLTEWSKGLGEDKRRFVVCTGGGPGIMEAANRGASEAKGMNIGLTISLPFEDFENPYVSRELNVMFHYFFMRKFWFTYPAKAVVLFPGGFGTLDELFEILTLAQTQKIKKRLPVVLFGHEFWDRVIDMDALIEFGTISPGDIDLFHRTDSVDDAYDHITRELAAHGLDEPGIAL